MKIVAFTGRAGSGKDTAAKVLVKNGWCRLAFADRVKDLALAINPIVISFSGCNLTLKMLVGEHGWDGAKRTFPEVRRLLQAVGTEGVRNVIGDTTWIDLLAKDVREIGALQCGPPGVVITDLRFPNEAEAIHDLGGRVIRISALRDDVATKSAEFIDRFHDSERLVESIAVDAVIYNSFDGEEKLHELVMAAVNQIPEPRGTT